MNHTSIKNKLNENRKITLRELAILELLKKGLSNETISVEIGVTVNTVKFHLKKIYRKLGAKNRIDAINKFNTINIKTNTS